MELQLTTGEIRLPIVRDGQASGEIVFNPNNLLFANQFYALLEETETGLKDLRERMKDLQNTDADGRPLQWRELAQIQIEYCDGLRGQIDEVFGAGTSQNAFGETRSLDVFMQFMNGLLPYFQTARVAKVTQYTSAATAKRDKRKR
jgi:hypothetical protein